MKFDVIVGNPPYQELDGGGNGSSAISVYPFFIKQAKDLKPEHIVMIVPARWQQGGKGLDSFRMEMLSDKRIRLMKTFNDSRACFKEVSIAGGVCYFHWQQDYQDKCMNIYVDSCGNTTEALRDLDELPVFVADNRAIGIIHTVEEKHLENYGSIVRSRNPFGIGRGKKNDNGDLKLRWREGMTTISSADVKGGFDLINSWKVVVSKTTAEHAGQADNNGQRKVMSVIEVLPPKTICSETYLVVDCFKEEERAVKLANYLKTRFARYLIWLDAPTQNLSKSCFSFLPVLPENLNVNDAELFEYFHLSEEQRRLIISSIKVIDASLNGGV